MNKELLLEELNQLLNSYSDSPEDFITEDGEQTAMWEEHEDHFWAICQKLPSWTNSDEWYVEENCADPDVVIDRFIYHINQI